MQRWCPVVVDFRPLRAWGYHVTMRQHLVTRSSTRSSRVVAYDPDRKCLTWHVCFFRMGGVSSWTYGRVALNRWGRAYRKCRVLQPRLGSTSTTGTFTACLIHPSLFPVLGKASHDTVLRPALFRSRWSRDAKMQSSHPRAQETVRLYTHTGEREPFKLLSGQLLAAADRSKIRLDGVTAAQVCDFKNWAWSASGHQVEVFLLHKRNWCLVQLVKVSQRHAFFFSPPVLTLRSTPLCGAVVGKPATKRRARRLHYTRLETRRLHRSLLRLGCEQGPGMTRSLDLKRFLALLDETLRFIYI